MDEVLRKVHRVDLNSSSASIRSAHGGDLCSHSLPETPAKVIENCSVPQVGEPEGIASGPTSEANESFLISLRQSLDAPVAQRLSLMEFFNFYKDIIEKVDDAAMEHDRKVVEMIQAYQKDWGMNFWGMPNFTQENFLMGTSLQDYNMYKYPTYSLRRRTGVVGRRNVARNTSLPTISESGEKYWNEETESPADALCRKQLESIPDNAVAPQMVPEIFLNVASTPPKEVRHSEEEEFLKAIEQEAIKMGLINNNETTNLKSDDKASPFNNDLFFPYTAAAIVFIYGDKMFIGSIGDSRCF